MKKTIIYFCLIGSFLVGCKAQLMQTLNDADKIQSNKDYYAGKRLRVLLNDVKPKIVGYSPLPDPTATKTAGLSLLFDTPTRHFNRMTNTKNRDEKPATIGVYFTDIDAVNQIVKNRRGLWTQGLADSLSNLIVQRAYAYGKN